MLGLYFVQESLPCNQDYLFYEDYLIHILKRFQNNY